MIGKDQASAVWLLQIGLLQEKKALCELQRSQRDVVLFCDSFYTRHTLAYTMKAFTGGHVKTTGTVKLNLIDKVNKIGVLSALQEFQSTEWNRGDWLLVTAYDAVSHDKLLSEMKSKSSSRTLFRRTSGFKLSDVTWKGNEPAVKSDKAGYIIFGDAKIVIVYTNDLLHTPSKDILHSNDKEAVEVVHGQAPIERWTGGEFVGRTVLHVPAPVVAYNVFMNGVDKMDQMRSTNPTRRREKKVSTTILTGIMDLCVHNAYVIYGILCASDKKEGRPKKKTLRDFKRAIAAGLVQPHLERKALDKARQERQRMKKVLAVSSSIPVSDHKLNELSKGTRLGCAYCLWKQRVACMSTIAAPKKKQYKTRFGCDTCKRGYHVSCFVDAHFCASTLENLLFCRKASKEDSG